MHKDVPASISEGGSVHAVVTDLRFGFMLGFLWPCQGLLHLPLQLLLCMLQVLQLPLELLELQCGLPRLHLCLHGLLPVDQGLPQPRILQTGQQHL